MPKEKSDVKLKITTECRKYPAGTKPEEIDCGKAKPYQTERREHEINANDQRF